MDRAAVEWMNSNKNPKLIPNLFNEFLFDLLSKDHSNCKKISCNSNPKCLNHLIPSLEMKPIENPIKIAVGIKNLGSTCYLNSLLQIWFRNSEFKRVVYKKELQANGLTRKLQMVFGKLEISDRMFIDVKDLVEELELSPAIQQDALEFGKLFISLIDGIINKTSLSSKPMSGEDISRPITIDENLAGCSKADSILSPNYMGENDRELLSWQFRGDMQYTTKCDHCRFETSRCFPFTELCLHFSNDMTLKQALDLLLKDERLINENQYFCSFCNQKRNATRSTRILSFPNTLNIVINRFVFDMKTMTKKKVNFNIIFPSFVELSSGSKEKKSFKLKAILLHQGTNANSGHYTAQVLDKTWLNCDDENIQVLDSFENQSKSAYLLVYEKDIDSKPVNIPKYLASIIEKDNDEYRKESECQAGKEYEKMKQFELKKCKYEELSHLFEIYSFEVMLGSKLVGTKDLSELSSHFVWVSLYELSNQITNECKLNESEIQCKHCRLNPLKLSYTKVIPTESLQTLCELNPKFKYYKTDEICIDCFTKNLEMKSFGLEHEMDLKIIKNSMKEEKDFYISKKWFNEFKKKKPKFEKYLAATNDEDMNDDSAIRTEDPSDLMIAPDFGVFRHDTVCKHGNFYNNPSNQVLISKSIQKLLSSKFQNLLLFDVHSESCCICQTETQISKQMQNSHLEILKRLKNKKSMKLYSDLQQYLIPSEFVAKWRKHLTLNKDLTELKFDSILCKHSKSLFSLDDENIYLLTESEWKFLQKEYEIKQEIAVNLENGKYVTEPKVCQECRTKRLQDYTNGTIRLVVTTVKTQSEIHARSSKAYGSDAVEDGKTIIDLTDDKPTHRPKRKRKNCNESFIYVTINPKMTLKELQFNVNLS